MNQNLVLIAEDDRDARDLLSFAVESAGYQAVCVRDGQTAVKILTTARPAALITDVRMPDLNGMELCRLTRSSGNNHTAILMVSASTHQHDIDAGIHAGADRYLPKPINPRQLATELQDVISNRAAN